MKNLLYIILVFGVWQFCDAQDNSRYRIKSSSLGSSGSSYTTETSKGTYQVSQSIGQASVIGTHKSNGYVLRQGYQQPLSGKTTSKTDAYALNAKVYPNPFKRHINITFNAILEDDIALALYDITGKLIHKQQFLPTNEIDITLNEIANGTYFLKVVSGQKFFTTKLIKI